MPEQRLNKTQISLIEHDLIEHDFSAAIHPGGLALLLHIMLLIIIGGLRI